MRLFTLFIILFSTTFDIQAQSYPGVQVQNKVMSLQIDSLKKNITSINSSIKKLELELKTKEKTIYSKLSKSHETLQQELKAGNNTLTVRVKQASDSMKTKITTIDNNVDNSIIWGMLGLAIIIGSGIGIYLQMKNKLESQSARLLDKIKDTKHEIEEEIIKLDFKTLELLESKLNQMSASVQTSGIYEVSDNHDLALKVADEIVRIQRNITFMDPNTRGIKQLTASVERIRENFEANGYNIIDMLNKHYNEGMNAIANVVVDDKLKPGEKIITRIIKPQVNYNNKMIQAAQIEVSQGVENE